MTKKYSSTEISKAASAHQARANAGFPSIEASIQLFTGPDIDKSPLTRSDFLRSIEIFGEHAARLKGTMTNHAVKSAPVSNETLTSNTLHRYPLHRRTPFSPLCCNTPPSYHH